MDLLNVELWGHTFESELAGCVEPAGWQSIYPCYAGNVYDGTTSAGTEARESCTDQAVGTEEIGLHLGFGFVVSTSESDFLSANDADGDPRRAASELLTQDPLLHPAVSIRHCSPEHRRDRTGSRPP